MLPGVHAALPSNPLRDVADLVIVGSPIHVGAHEKSIREFVVAHAGELGEEGDLPSAFFSVSLAAAWDGHDSVAKLVQKFCEEAGWHPRLVGIFGGALAYTQYGFVKKFVMKQIARHNHGPTDTSRDYELTDYAVVDAFVASAVEEATRPRGKGQGVANQLQLGESIVGPPRGAASATTSKTDVAAPAAPVVS